MNYIFDSIMKAITIKALDALKTFFRYSADVSDTREALRAVLDEYAQMAQCDSRQIEEQKQHFAICRALVAVLDSCGKNDIRIKTKRGAMVASNVPNNIDIDENALNETAQMLERMALSINAESSTIGYEGDNGEKTGSTIKWTLDK